MRMTKTQATWKRARAFAEEVKERYALDSLDDAIDRIRRESMPTPQPLTLKQFDEWAQAYTAFAHCMSCGSPDDRSCGNCRYAVR